jgi:glycosyltransferase involved in cell wall biosynthesis
LLDIVTGLPPERFEWHVFLPRGQGFDKLLQQREIACEYLMPANLADMSGVRKALVYGRVLNRLRRLKPDLLYVNQTGSLRAAALYARILRLPVVCQVQTLEDARWLSGRPELQRQVQAFICNSQFIASATDIDSAKKCCLYQGLPCERMQRVRDIERKPAVMDAQSPVLGILGRIAHSKGHYLLVDAAKRLVAQLPKCRFVVIGEGLTPSDTEHYRQCVATAGLASHFEFRGYRTDLASELGRLDLLLIPSIAEPLGRVLFDAAEHGVPVVLSDAGGLGELARRFKLGVSFQSENADSLAQSVIEALKRYEQVTAEFQAASIRMFERLPMSSYLDAVASILQAATQGECVSRCWLGDE